MSLHRSFKRGDRVTSVSGQDAGTEGTFESQVFQRSVGYPGESGPGYHVVLDPGTVVTVAWMQVDFPQIRCRPTRMIPCWASSSDPQGSPPASPQYPLGVKAAGKAIRLFLYQIA